LRHEAQCRTQLAVSLLGSSGLVAHPDGYNVWLPMPRDATQALVAAAAARGVQLTLPDSMVLRPSDSASGLRICLGAASWDDLNAALALLAALLSASAA